MSTLNNLPLGHTATVVAVGGEGSLRQHFLDMGIIPQVDVTMVKHAPMGDPVEVRVHGYELTLRLDDARRIEVEDERAVADRPRRERACGASSTSRSRCRTPASARAAGSTTRPTSIRCPRASP